MQVKCTKSTKGYTSNYLPKTKIFSPSKSANSRRLLSSKHIVNIHAKDTMLKAKVVNRGALQELCFPVKNH